MRHVAWLTDLHLNFLDVVKLSAFLDQVVARRPDAVLISGDIGEARSVIRYLEQLAAAWPLPIYFVLGNHDFYFGSIREIREQVAELCQRHANLHWLGSSQVAELAPRTALVGHDGWADARLGDYERSTVMMNDYRLIAELANHTKATRWPLLQALGDEAAEHFRRVLPAALARYPHVVLVTHVPPFREACWHEGQVSNDEWLPHFSCRAAGEAILEVMRRFPDRRVTVLCGHTHGIGVTRPADNVVVYTGGASYGEPEIQKIFEWD
ncbi:MAG: metallophosphoesterase [Planctomycetaceae bacterium]|nr:metallophosphoesterase [Planctomycetaceae bacterium]